MNFVIAQIFGFFGLISSVLSMQMKSKRNIMIFLLGLNLSAGFSLLFLGSISGAAISFFASAQTIINYMFDRKKKKLPRILLTLYIIAIGILAFATFKTVLDIFPIICALIFCTMISIKKESTIRILMLVNQFFWLYYDIRVGAILFAVANILTIVSSSVSIYRFDIKKKTKRPPQRRS